MSNSDKTRKNPLLPVLLMAICLFLGGTLVFRYLLLPDITGLQVQAAIRSIGAALQRELMSSNSDVEALFCSDTDNQWHSLSEKKYHELIEILRHSHPLDMPLDNCDPWGNAYAIRYKASSGEAVTVSVACERLDFFLTITNVCKQDYGTRLRMQR